MHAGLHSVSHFLAMQDTKVFVLGDILLDAYISGKASRISPEAPVAVIHQSEQRWVAGGAANVAANVAFFGAKAWLCGRVGLDADGERLLKICESMGVDTSHTLRSDVLPTITKTRVLAGYQQIVRIDNEVTTPLTPDEEKRALRFLEDFLSFDGNKVVILSDYQKGMLSRSLVMRSIALCNESRVPVVTDPKTTDVARYSGSAVVKPNLKDGREILRALRPLAAPTSFDDEIAMMCDCYLEAGVRNVVLSMSERGAYVKGVDVPSPVLLKPQVLQVADVSGAGDTMVAFLSMALAAAFSIEDSVRIGNIAAGIACSKPGTATVSMAEFLNAAREKLTEVVWERVLNEQDIATVAAQAREAGKKVVFTNGCFDILHAGHVRLLQEARSFGDILVVGLNSDASVQRLKGPTRPIQKQEDRAEILQALACVDFVAIFDEETPINLIKAIAPDVLVKGGDYVVDTIVGAAEVIARGGRVEIVSLVEGRSTTRIVERSRDGQ
jgi:D-beta-D-heptose 7-phosphate kinase/D-beta-D-heptose 1-phosphate adenosyltransferase